MTTAGRPALAPFAVPAFRLLFAGRFADGIATAIAPLAVAFAVLDLGGSATDLGLVLTARSLPMVVLLLVGGVVADRFPRHHVVLTGNLVGALTQSLVLALLVSGHASIPAIAAIQVVNGGASAFLYPAASGLTAQTVPGALLQPANALLRLGINGSLVLGQAAGGGLVATLGPSWGFGLDAIMFLVAAALLSRIRLPRGEREQTAGMMADLRAGWTEFASRTWLWVVVVAFGFVNMAIAAGFVTLGPVIADRTFGRAGWGLVLAAMTGGMIVGGLLALRANWSRPLFVGMLCVFFEVPLLVLLGLHPQTLDLVAAGFLAGIGIEVFGVAWDVSLQANVPEDKLSRVYAYDWFGSLVFTPIGQALAGPLVVATSLRAAPVFCGVVMVLATAGTLMSKSVRTLRRHDVTLAPQ